MSKIIGEFATLSEGWQLVRLGDICKTTSGGTPSRKNPAYYEGNIPWVKSGELPDGPVLEIAETVSEEAIKNSSAKLFPSGSLLVAMYGATVGKLGILNREAATNQAVCAIFPSEALENKYLFWYLRAVRSDLVSQAVGGAQPNISQGILREIPIPIAPLEQQKRIVAEIEKQFSRLDEAVANLKRVKANLKRYKAAVLKAAVEGKLTEEWRKQHPDVEPADKLLERILAERRENWEQAELAKMESRGKMPKDDKWKVRYKEPFQLENSKLKCLPRGWVWGCWDQISIWVTYGFTRPMEHVEKGIPIITAKHVVNGGIDFVNTHKTPIEAYKNLSEKDRPSEGDILITKDGTIGRAAVVPAHQGFCINQSVAVVWLRLCPIDRQFLLAVIESDLTQRPIWEKARGVAIKHLSITDFAKLPVPIPPAEEQIVIVAELKQKLSIIDEVESEVETNLRRGNRLRRSILKKAFSGSLLKSGAEA